MADYKGLQVKFEGDDSALSAVLHHIATDAQHAQGELAGIGKGLDQNPRSLELMRDRVKETGSALDAAKGRVEAFGKGIEQAKGIHDSLSKSLSEGKSALKDYVGSNIDEYRRNISAIEDHKAALESDQRSLELIEQAGQRGSDIWERYADSIEGHKKAIEEATRANEGMDDACETAAQQFDNLTDQVREYEAEIEKMEGEVHKGEAAIESWKDKLVEAASVMRGTEFSQSSIGTFAQSLRDGGDMIANVGDKISGIESKILAVAGVSAVTFGQDMIRDVEEYGNAISKLGGYLDIQGADLERMSDLALTWGKDTQFSATEAADAMSELAKGGLTEAEIRGGAMASTMSLAAAGGIDMARAAEVAVQSIKTFGLSAEDSTSVADALAGAANKSTAEIEDLATGFKYVGGWASMAGWDINDVSGALGLLADHGLQGEMAGTALRNVMQRLAAPTKKARELMEQYGFSVRDSEGHMVDAVEMVKRLNESFGELGDEERQQVLNDIFGARALPAAIALMEEGDKSLQGYIDSTKQAGYASEMAQSQMSDMGWALEYLRGEAETAMVNLGKVFEPLVTKGAKAIEHLLSWFNRLSDEEQANVVQTGLAVAAFGPFLSVIGRLSSGIGTAVLGIGGFMSGVSGLGPGVSLATRLTEGFATSFVSLGADGATAMSGATAAMTGLKAGLIGLGITVAAIGLAAFFIEATEEARKLEENGRLVGDALHGISDNMHGIGDATDDASGKVKDYAAAASDASEHLRDLTDSISDHNERISGISSEAETNIGLLEEYAGVIEEMSGKGAVGAEDMERLRSALDGIHDITGEVYEAEQVLTDQIQDEAGETRNARDAILELIDSKKRQLEVDAYGEMYADTLKERVKAEHELAEIQKDQTEAQERYNEAYSEYKSLGYDDTIASQWAEQKSNLQEANEAMWQAEGLYKKLGDEADFYAGRMGEASMAARDTAQQQQDAAQQLDEAWKLVAESTGQSIDELKASLDEAGISSENLQQVGGAAFAMLAQQAQGDMDTLTQLIQDYNAAEFEDKYPGIYVQDGEIYAADGKRMEWNGAEWVWHKTGVTVTTDDLLEAQRVMADTQGKQDQMHDTNTKMEASGNVTDGSAKEQIDRVKGAQDALSDKTIRDEAHGNAHDGSAERNLYDLIAAQNGLQDTHVTHTIETIFIDRHVEEHAAGGIRTHADGGFRWHAGGSIVDAPGIGYPLDMVGEDGAEAIVPLTNKRYAQPFVDMIAEGVAGLMPQGGNTYVIDGLSYLPGSVVERHVDAIFAEAARKVAM